MAIALTPSYEAWIALNEARAAEQRPDLWRLSHVDRVACGIFSLLVGEPGLRADPPPVAQAAHDFLRVEGWHPFGPPQDRVWVPCDGGNPLATAKALALAEREFTARWPRPRTNRSGLGGRLWLARRLSASATCAAGGTGADASGAGGSGEH